MQYKATREGNVVDLFEYHDNNTASLRVSDADNLAAEINALIAAPSTPDVDKVSYRLLSTPTGARVTNDKGHIDIPWRWLATVAKHLET